jgi:hypothetical protein
MDAIRAWLVTEGPRAAALAALAFTFGVVLKVSDLLQEHGFRWFRGAANFAGCICAAEMLAILQLGDQAQSIFWLAVCLHWILRARIDGVNHGIFATAMLVWLLFRGPSVPAHALEFVYFFGALAVLGLLHDLFQYTDAPAPTWVKWFFANQHLYWYLLGLGHFARTRNFTLLVTIVAFVKGYGFLYDERRYALLERIGIRRAAPVDQKSA